jgi:hypothetical protein
MLTTEFVEHDRVGVKVYGEVNTISPVENFRRRYGGGGIHLRSIISSFDAQADITLSICPSCDDVIDEMSKCEADVTVDELS